ncbi:MAG: M48 family metalloprotease [Polyangiaceae bacterium]|nr:M48 family metalloprotease [Polyangiaceae bacterium]
MNAASAPPREGAGEPNAPASADEKHIDLYPPSPSFDDKSSLAALRAPTREYRVRVVLVLLSLIAFLTVYLGLIACTGYLFYISLDGPFASTQYRKSYGFFDVVLTIGSAMLFLFFAKGLFKRSRLDTSKYVEISEKEQPRLFAFVRSLCHDSGTPMPRSIFLSHDVNAAVFYPRSLLSLVIPSRKNLLLGLGLLNLLNVSELKAVLAHEFGHFAQSSMKLGQYVYVANQAIYDMVVARDSWDVWLARWRSVDLRLSFPAWIITGVVWVLRQLLKLLFKAVNVANLSLMRQMEFNADLCAVSLTGSDALISGLWKTERGGLAMQRALSRLHSLAEHKKFSDDLFFHQSRELSRLDALLDENEQDSAYVKSIRDPYRYGPEVHFHEGDDHAPSMWSTHPSNRERELNAKRSYMPLEPVEKSAWALLEGRKKLKKKLTILAYDELLSVKARDCLPAEEIQALSEEEEVERKQADHYHGFYEARAVDLGDFGKLIASLDGATTVDLPRIRERAAAYSGKRLAAFMRKHKRAHKDLAALTAFVEHDKGSKGPLEIRGKRYTLREAQARIVEAREKAAEFEDRIKNADRALFRHFYYRATDPEVRAELVRRYRFLIGIQELILELKPREQTVAAVVHMLSQGSDFSPDQVRAMLNALGAAYDHLEQIERRCRGLRMPKLQHIEEGASVASFVLPEGLVPPMDRDEINGAWLMPFVRQLNQVTGRLRKLHFKNLGVLLRLQEELDPELYEDALKAEPDGSSTEAGEGEAGAGEAGV